jgi:hypothetical protein
VVGLEPLQVRLNDTLAGLEHDAESLDAANTASRAAQRSYEETSGTLSTGRCVCNGV